MGRIAVASWVGLLFAVAAGCKEPPPSAVKDAGADTKAAREAVFLHVRLNGEAGENERVKAWVESLDAALHRDGAGMLYSADATGNELVVMMYGPSADAMWTTLKPLCTLTATPSGSYAIKRHGESGAPQEKIDLPPS